MTVSIAASRTFLSIRLGRFEVFTQRETAPVACYGITRMGGRLQPCRSPRYSGRVLTSKSVATGSRARNLQDMAPSPGAERGVLWPKSLNFFGAPSRT